MLSSSAKDLLVSLLERLAQQADEKVPATRIPLLLNNILVGHLKSKDANLLNKTFRFIELDGPCTACRILADNVQQASRRIAVISHFFKQTGLVSAWRDELLPVVSVKDFGRTTVLANIERAMARPFALSTFAVHLNPYTADGRLWVAQRSFKKAINPGYWDNCAAGMVPIGETFINAMGRESWEEAGIPGGSLTFRFLSRHLISREVREGWMFEHTVMFDAEVQEDFNPLNVDGEVQKFELLTQEEVIRRVAAGSFTFESSLSVLLSIANKNGLSAELVSYQRIYAGCTILRRLGRLLHFVEPSH